MKITMQTGALSAALAIVGRAISGRTSVPILSHTKVVPGDDRVTLTGTDLDTAISCEVEALVDEPCTIAIPFAPLQDYVGRLPDAPVTLEYLDNKLEVRSGKSKYKMLTSPAADFPQVTWVDEKDEVLITAAALKEMLRMTAFAASKEEARSQLMGVLFELSGNELKLVATDTHRLALKSITLPSATHNFTATVPAKPLIDLERVLKASGDEMVSIRASASQVQFRTRDCTMVSRVIEGQFPSYSKVIPAGAQRIVTFNRDEMLSLLQRIQIVARENNQKACFDFSDDLAAVKSATPEAGESEDSIAIEMEGERLAIAYNVSYFIQALSVMPAGAGVVAQLKMNGALNPGVLKMAKDDSWLCVIMPMQV